VAAQSAVAPRDRAVVTGLRNFSRFIAGAIGLAVCGTIRNTVLRARLADLSDVLSPAQVDSLISTGQLAAGMVESEALRAQVTRAYMDALHAVFILFVPLAGVSAILSAFIPVRRQRSAGRCSIMTAAQNRKLGREPKPVEAKQTETEESKASATAESTTPAHEEKPKDAT
jgi:hypothetical protein